MISSNEIITGEKIQLECEHFIGNSGCIINPKIIKEAQSRFLTNDIVNIEEKVKNKEYTDDKLSTVNRELY